MKMCRQCSVQMRVHLDLYPRLSYPFTSPPRLPVIYFYLRLKRWHVCKIYIANVVFCSAWRGGVEREREWEGRLIGSV